MYSDGNINSENWLEGDRELCAEQPQCQKLENQGMVYTRECLETRRGQGSERSLCSSMSKAVSFWFFLLFLKYATLTAFLGAFVLTVLSQEDSHPRSLVNSLKGIIKYVSSRKDLKNYRNSWVILKMFIYHHKPFSISTEIDSRYLCSNFSQEASRLCSVGTPSSNTVLNILFSFVSPLVLFNALFPCSLSVSCGALQ